MDDGLVKSIGVSNFSVKKLRVRLCLSYLGRAAGDCESILYMDMIRKLSITLRNPVWRSEGTLQTVQRISLHVE